MNEKYLTDFEGESAVKLAEEVEADFLQRQQERKPLERSLI